MTELDGEGHKRSGRVLDGANLIAEQLNPAGGQPFVRWHHRDPLNLVARDTEAGQVVRRVHAVTPNGAQVETTDGVDLNRYYACLLGGDNNPTCTGYTPQPAASYGYLADQANGMLAGGLKVDGALTLLSLNSLMEQIVRTRLGGLAYISPALRGTPVSQGVGGSFVRTTTMDWVEETGNAFDVWGWVPGGGSTGGQNSNVRGLIETAFTPLTEAYPQIGKEILGIADLALKNDDCAELVGGNNKGDVRSLLKDLNRLSRIKVGDVKKIHPRDAAATTYTGEGFDRNS